MAKKNRPSVIIRRQDGGGHAAHHGGAWKIAYADFMTAMMAFFLVMWLLNATTDEQRRGISQYFNPLADQKSAVPPTKPIDSPPSPTSAGSRFDHLEDDEDDSDTTGPVPVPDKSHSSTSALEEMPVNTLAKLDKKGTLAAIVPIGGAGSSPTAPLGSGNSDVALTEQANLKTMTENLEKSLKTNPETKAQIDNFSVSYGRKEIRIELHDTENEPMFDLAASSPNKRGTAMLTEIAKWLAPMPERVSIVGYTDAAPFRGNSAGAMSNWTLSALRADRAREVLVKAGFSDGRIQDVVGGADRELAKEADPSAAANRRVVIVLHRQHPIKGDPAQQVAPDTAPAAAASSEKETTSEPKK
ncbi:flagellar motor protein MotB [Asaia astilbis]|uniref:flagellar motor protein MotB n=1 Tax=Asaia astilbis TaxID=610244 RepID=UPI00046E8C7A|nr:flagellar motor protein MotB [Asaia astilbis]